MAPQDSAGVPPGARHWRAALAVALLLVAGVARAEPPVADAAIDLALPPAQAGATAPGALVAEWNQSLADAAFFGADFQSDAAAAPAAELVEGVDVQVTQKRRKFRARAIDWMSERSETMGLMTDLLLGGADTGFHLVVDPTGQDEYILEWKARF
jgi:hypothetical protein